MNLAELWVEVDRWKVLYLLAVESGNSEAQDDALENVLDYLVDWMGTPNQAGPSGMSDRCADCGAD